jgi:hypothetical protein
VPARRLTTLGTRMPATLLSNSGIPAAGVSVGAELGGMDKPIASPRRLCTGHGHEARDDETAADAPPEPFQPRPVSVERDRRAVDASTPPPAPAAQRIPQASLSKEPLASALGDLTMIPQYRNLPQFPRTLVRTYP